MFVVIKFLSIQGSNFMLCDLEKRRRIDLNMKSLKTGMLWQMKLSVYLSIWLKKFLSANTGAWKISIEYTAISQ